MHKTHLHGLLHVGELGGLDVGPTRGDERLDLLPVGSSSHRTKALIDRIKGAHICFLFVHHHIRAFGAI
jgi:hypothetical protein